MILEIAAGVCLGIVGAVALLLYWRRIFSVLAALTVWFIVIGGLVWGASSAWSHRAALKRSTAIHVLAALAVVAGAAAPLLTYKYAARRYPDLRALLFGEPPWDQAARTPVRYLLILLMAVGGAAIGAAGCFGAARIGDWVVRTWW